MATTDKVAGPTGRPADGPVADPNQYLTMEEIEKRFDRQWVLIDRPKVKPGPVVLGGYVVGFGPERADIDRFVDVLPALRHVAVRYIGPVIDDEDEVIL